MIYFSSIILAAVIVGALNYFFNFAAFDFNAWNIVLCVAVSLVAVGAIDGLFATLVRWICPKKWFAVEKEGFAASKKECRFYEKLGIKKWKDKVVELGFFTGFRKNKIADPNNNEYVARYIIEANYGIGVHVAGMIFGFLVCLVFPAHWYSIGLPVGFVNMIVNSLSFMILRYNLPKLRTLYRINAKRAARREKTAQAEENKSQTA